jgi:hypothetical protein
VLSWSYHVFLIVDGVVIDMDYRQLNVEGVAHFRSLLAMLGVYEYLQAMWSDSIDELRFQVRPIDEIVDLTELTIKESVASGVYPVMNAEELQRFIGISTCEEDLPYYRVGADKPY